ncbi:MAG: hypothetical protein AAFQ22_12625 [Pseudomonadota bacterium]
MSDESDKRDDAPVSPPANVDNEVQKAFELVRRGADPDRLKKLLDNAKSELGAAEDDAKSA